MNDYVPLYQWISIIAYIAAGLFFAAAVFIFFFLNIADVVGYLSGRTQRRAIEAIQAENSQQKDSEPVPGTQPARVVQTDKISSQKLTEAAAQSMKPGNETELLQEVNETVLLQEQKHGETACLQQQKEAEENWVERESVEFVIEESIVFVHTNETIE